MLETLVGVCVGTRSHFDVLVNANQLGKLSLQNTTDFSGVLPM